MGKRVYLGKDFIENSYVQVKEMIKDDDLAKRAFWFLKEAAIILDEEDELGPISNLLMGIISCLFLCFLSRDIEGITKLREITLLIVEEALHRKEESMRNFLEEVIRGASGD